MKKISFIIVGGMVALAACTNNAGNNTKMQATIDSTVNAFVTAQKEVLTKACDDQLMAAAQDSAKVMMEKSKKGGHVVAHHAPVVKAAPATGGLGAGSGKIGTQTGTPAKLGEGKVGTTNANTNQAPAKLGQGKIGTQKK